MNISDLLAWAARQFPEKECVVEVDPQENYRRVLTYRQFDQRVNMVAHSLLNAGVKKGDRVLHFMKNRIEWMESYFGIIRIGAIVVPLNFRFTGADLGYVGKTVEPSISIVDDDLLGIITDIESYENIFDRIMCVGDNVPETMTGYEETIAGHSGSPPDIEISDGDDLGIYFTSGTTGLPKPILYTHKNLYTIAVSNGFTIPLPQDHNSIIYCPLYHTATFFFWLPSLFQGGKATLLLKYSSRNLLKVFEQERGTEVNIPMPHCVDMITAQQTGEINVEDYDLSSWALINTGAQPYPPSVIKDMTKLLPTVGIQHGFGISEGGGATLTRLGPDEILKRPGSVGRTAVMVDAKVVDKNGMELPPGEVGELIIRSERTMKGYYKNPDATTAAIINGWLYTGDIARMDDDGYFYIVDRKKDVVISGGENVYPVEVENVLMTHPKILEVAVIGTPDKKWGERVTAVVMLKPNEEMTEDELLDWCRSNFPNYNRPRSIIFGEIPKSPTNKVLKHELRLTYCGRESAF